MNPGQPVQVVLSKHKSVAAAIGTVISILMELVVDGTLSGTILHAARVVIALAALLGITASVYVTPAKARLVHPLPYPHD